MFFTIKRTLQRHSVPVFLTKGLSECLQVFFDSFSPDVEKSIYDVYDHVWTFLGMIWHYYFALAGLHCASPGLPRASGQCAAGHYCVGGALTPHPSNGITGDLCPRGHYCSEGSAVPQPCPPGHYSNTTKNTALSDCLPCPQGLHGQVQPKYTPYGFVNRQQHFAAQF